LRDRPALRRPGTPTAEAWIESLNGQLKGEYPHLPAIRDSATLRAELEITRAHYNGIRLHQASDTSPQTTNTKDAARPSARPAKPGSKPPASAALLAPRHRQIGQHPARVVVTRAPSQPGRRVGQRRRHPARIGHVGQQPGSGAGHDTCPSAVAVIGGRVVVACTNGVPSSPGGSDLQAQNPKDRRFLRSTHVSRHHDQIVTATPGLPQGGNHFAIGVAKALHSAAHNGKG
jgi:hypothetical protein